MEHVSAEMKVKGGKFVRVRIAHEGGVTFQIHITGDFFVHPEEGLEFIERSLVGLRVPSTIEIVERIVNEVLADERITVIGFSSSDLANLVVGALA
jgi:lipoate-protein ligase A